MGAKTTTCRQCGKAFWVPYPAEYAYRDGKLYFCSWKCIRAHDAGTAPNTDGVEQMPTDALTPAQEAAFHEADKRNRKNAMRVQIHHGRQRRPVEEKLRILREVDRLHDRGMSYYDAAKKVGGCSPQSVVNWYKKYWRTAGVKEYRPTSPEERIDLMNKARAAAAGKSKEKTERIAATIRRIHQLIDEIREEATA